MIDPPAFRRLLSLLLLGLTDYSIDQRGDVGSWVRMASVSALVSAIISALRYISPRGDDALREYFPPNVFQECVSGILKQGVERLDNVRQLVGEEMQRLVGSVPQILEQSESNKPWKLHGMATIRDLTA